MVCPVGATVMTASRHHFKQVAGIETRLKQITRLEKRLADEAKHLRAKARKLANDGRQVALGKRAAETGAHISEWLSSPGLQPPK